jgi:tetratricopeptide (TPR) repeat protein
MRELALAFQRAGDVLGNPTQANLGDLQGAVTAYGRAVTIARTLASAQPDDVNALWTLALCLEKAADAEAPSGQVKLALEHQQESLALFRQVARTDTTRTNYLRAVGISALKLGDLLGHPAFTNAGDTAASMRAYRESAEQLDRATLHGDTTFFVRRHRAVLGERLGRLLQERGTYGEARRWLDASLALRRALSAENPKSLQSRRDLAIALYVQCGLSLAESKSDEALTSCSESLAIRRALLAEDGQNGSLVRGMGIMHRRMGEVRAQLGDTTAALREYAAAISYYERFFAGRSGAVNDRRDIAYALLERADLAASRRDGESVALAERSVRDAVASFDSISTRMPLTSADSSRIARSRQRLTQRAPVAVPR